MTGAPLEIDARARTLAPELVSCLGDAATWVEREGALLGDEQGGAIASVAGLRVATRPRPDLVDALVLEPLPGDRAESPNTFLLGLGDGSALVPELRQDAFDAIGLVHERALGRLVQTFLDVQAAELEQRGLAVYRLPMMAPVDLERVPERPESWVGTFVSPTQSLLVDAGARVRALCPRVDESRFPDSYRELAHAQRGDWESFFGARGYDVSFVDVTRLAAQGKSLRSLVRG